MKIRDDSSSVFSFLLSSLLSCSLLLQFPEEVATVTCVDAMGKEKIMWTVTAAIMRAMELDVDTL